MLPESCLACGASGPTKYGEVNLAARYIRAFLREAMGDPPGRIPLLRCSSCGTIALAEPLPDGVYRAWYRDARYMFVRGGGYGDPDEEALRHGRACLSWLSANLTRGVRRVLDVGCGRGFFLGVCAAAGWEAHGCEIKPEYAREARQRSGVEVWEGSFLDCPVAHRYDILTFWDAFEHFPDPKAILGKVRASLGQGGYLALEVPNCRSLYARVLGRRWWFGAEHCAYYSAAGIQALLAGSGFRIVSIETDNVNLLSREGLARLGFLGQDAVWGRASGRGSKPTLAANAATLGAHRGRWEWGVNERLNRWFNGRLMGDQLRVLAQPSL